MTQTATSEIKSARYVYELFDLRDRTVLDTYPEEKRWIARRRASQLDLAYGAVRFIVRMRQEMRGMGVRL